MSWYRRPSAKQFLITKPNTLKQNNLFTIQKEFLFLKIANYINNA